MSDGNGNFAALEWRENGRRTVYRAPVFDVTERFCKPPTGGETVKTFYVLDSHECALTLPLLTSGGKREFVMVRQWRPGPGLLSLEFPGGIIEDGEEAESGARRELREETGFEAGKMTRLAVMSPNPAIMSTKVHFFLAEDLRNTGIREPDADEFMNVEKVPVDEVIRGMGERPYIHALMAAALGFFMRLDRSGK